MFWRDWSRSERLSLISIVFGVLAATAAWYVVPEFRLLFGLPSASNAPPTSRSETHENIPVSATLTPSTNVRLKSSDNANRTDTDLSDTISLHNPCSREISVAVHYQTNSGDWWTAGWWTVHPKETVIPDIKSSGTTVFFYSYDSTGEWTGENEKPNVDREVYTDAFDYVDGLPPKLQGKRTVSFFGIDAGDTYGEVSLEFGCK